MIMSASEVKSHLVDKLKDSAADGKTKLCQELFHFELPSVQLARRRKLFLDKFCVCV